MRPSRRSPRTGDYGFTLVELLVVMGIIVIMIAVALPRIGRYFRNYQMNAAVREVTGEIQGARNRGIMKNVNFGSVFYIVSATTYRTALEDDQNPAGGGRLPRALTLDEAEADAAHQATPLRTLPGDVRFGTGCTQGGAFAANDIGVRFNRLGAACDPDSAPGSQCRLALAHSLNPPSLVMNDVSGSRICLTQASTGLRRLIQISPGGRVVGLPGQG